MQRSCFIASINTRGFEIGYLSYSSKFGTSPRGEKPRQALIKTKTRLTTT